MKKNTKRWIAVALAAVVVGFIGLNVLAYNHAWAMMHYTVGGDRTSKPEGLGGMQKVKVLLVGVNIPRPSGLRSSSDLAADCRELKISVPDGITLEAWYCATSRII